MSTVVKRIARSIKIVRYLPQFNAYELNILWEEAEGSTVEMCSFLSEAFLYPYTYKKENPSQIDSKAFNRKNQETEENIDVTRINSFGQKNSLIFAQNVQQRGQKLNKKNQDTNPQSREKLIYNFEEAKQSKVFFNPSSQQIDYKLSKRCNQLISQSHTRIKNINELSMLDYDQESKKWQELILKRNKQIVKISYAYGGSKKRKKI